MSRDYLSKSQIDSMNRCEYAFLRRYGFGEISPANWSMHMGSAVDRAANKDYAQKIETHVNLPSSDVVEQAVEEFRGLNESEETQWDKGVTEDVAVDHLAETMAVFHANIMKGVQPVSVQEEVYVGFEGEDWGFLGYVDVVRIGDSGASVVGVDNKATGRSGGWKTEDAIRANDWLAYDLGLRAAGHDVEGFEYHVARYGSGSGKFLVTKQTQVIALKAHEEARNGFLKLLAERKARKDTILAAGIAPPRYDWHCKGCGYRAACAKEWGREPPGGD